MKIRVKKTHKDAVIPSYAKEGDVGLDLTAVSRKSVGNMPDGYIEYDTGLAFEIPEGYGGFVMPRSSITNKPMLLKNSVGVIDSNYRGSVKLRFLADEEDAVYEIGERIGQIVIMPVPYVQLVEAEELTDTVRGEGGFGSTGS